MNNRTVRRRRSVAAGGFTLIELLLVMIILAILAAIVVPKFTGQSEHAKQSAAKADLSNIQVALAKFEVENGRFPTTQEGLGALVDKPSNDLTNWTRGLDKSPNDPWGHPYVYRQPGTNGREYDLLSSGPDGNVGGGDDIQL